ncbi:hypothetical protein ABPG73_020862 [Tetrahymena malaccensis]
MKLIYIFQGTFEYFEQNVQQNQQVNNRLLRFILKEYSKAKQFDQIREIQYFLTISNTFTYMALHASISQAYKVLNNNQNSQDSSQNSIYLFILFSVATLAFINCQVINVQSFHTRYLTFKLRNILKYTFIFSSIFTQYQIFYSLQNSQLYYPYLFVQCGIVFTLALWQTQNLFINITGNDIFRDLMKIFGFLMNCSFNLELLIYPIYQEPLSLHYQNYCKGKRYYLLLLQRVIFLCAIKYILSTDDFQQQKMLFCSQIIITIYLIFSILSFIFIVAKAFNLFERAIQLKKLIQENNRSNDKSSYQALSQDEQQNYLEQIISKIEQTKFLNKLTIINLNKKITENECCIKLKVLEYLLQKNVSNQSFLICNDDDYWFAKDGNILSIFLNDSKVEEFSDFLVKFQSPFFYDLSISLEAKLKKENEKILIKGLVSQLFHMNIHFNNQSKGFETLSKIVNEQKLYITRNIFQIIASKNYLSTSQYIYYVQALYDLYD